MQRSPSFFEKFVHKILDIILVVFYHGYETTNVWKIDPCFDKIHPAIFPIELCKQVVQYYSFQQDLVFDSFAGSGTVGRTAKNLSCFFFLTEIDKKYFEYMKNKANNTIFDEWSIRFFYI